MGDIIDFTKPAAKQKKPEDLVAGDAAELEYDLKPGSVGVKLVTEPSGTATFTVTVAAADLAEAMTQAEAGIAATFGAMPEPEVLAAIRSQMGDATYDGFITTFVQQHFFTQALLRTGVMPFLDPDHLTAEAPVPGEDYVFQMQVLLRPTYTLSSYEPVKVQMPQKADVTSKDVTAYLDNMAKELATWENDPAATEVQLGSHVSLNLDSTADGKPFPQLTGRHIPYLVGTMQLGEEFDAQFVGMAPRERKEFTLVLPIPAEDGSIVEQTITVKAQIDEIHRSVPAKIDDAWVMQNMPEAQTLLGLRNKVRSMLEREAERANHDELMVLTAEALAGRLEGDPDERYVVKMRNELLAETMQRLQAQGISLEMLFEQPEFDREAWEADLTEQARQSLRRGLALDALADHLDIKLEEKDIAAVVSQMAPGREQEMYQSLVDSGQMPKMCEIALRMRANEWLVDHLAKPRAARNSDGPKLTLL